MPALLPATLLLLGLGTAHADVAGGPFERETCTVDKKEQDGTTCEACSSWFGAGQDSAEATCEDQYAGTDFSYVCSTDGASTWTEVWCDGPPREGCGGCATGGVGAGGAVLGGLVLLGLAWRRRD